MIRMNKRGVEVLPVFLLLGLVVGFTVFMLNVNSTIRENDANPFYGSLGERELMLLGMQSQIQGDLTTLDILALHSLRTTLKREAIGMYTLSDECYSIRDVPVINHGDCLQEYDVDDLRDDMKRSFSSELFTRQVSSDLPFPFNYDFVFVQDDEHLVVQAYADDPVHYPIDSESFQEGDYRPEPREGTSSLAFDLSGECHYDENIVSSLPDDISNELQGVGTNRDKGPCPDDIEPRFVPYMNQCNIPECASGFCNIDEGHICEVGCGFKSTQMAYAFHGFEFSELDSINTDSVDRMIPEIRSERPSSISDQDHSIDADYDTLDVTFSTGSTDTVEVADEITTEDYEEILEHLSEGLVRIELVMTSSSTGDERTHCDTSNDVGYCTNRHFVLAIDGNDDYLVIHDPFTPGGREYRTGMNLVVGRNFIETYWTGNYRVISGDSA